MCKHKAATLQRQIMSACQIHQHLYCMQTTMQDVQMQFQAWYARTHIGSVCRLANQRSNISCYGLSMRSLSVLRLQPSDSSRSATVSKIRQALFVPHPMQETFWPRYPHNGFVWTLTYLLCFCCCFHHAISWDQHMKNGLRWSADILRFLRYSQKLRMTL